MDQLKVIFHIDELNKWDMVLNNVSNLLNAKEANNNIIIEVLANGQAVINYDRNKSADSIIERIKKLNKLGVDFAACNNSLKGNNINKENILELVKIVPAGVLELIEKQNEGYAYIKP